MRTFSIESDIADSFTMNCIVSLPLNLPYVTHVTANFVELATRSRSLFDRISNLPPTLNTMILLTHDTSTSILSDRTVRDLQRTLRGNDWRFDLSAVSHPPSENFLASH